MASEFPKPTIPKADNVHGSPQPPSGTHPADPKPAVTGHLGGKPKPAPTSKPASNIHK